MSGDDDKLRDLRDLLEAGMLSQDEYDAMAQAVLDDSEGAVKPKPQAKPKSLADRAPPPPPKPSARVPFRPPPPDLPATLGSEANLVRFGHIGLGGLTVLTSLFGIVMGLAGGEPVWLIYSAIWLVLGVAQVGLGASLNKRDQKLWAASLILSGLQAFTCSILGIILLAMHLNPAVQRDLQA